jgi:ATP sulfurylase
MWNKQPKAGEERAEPSRIPHQITSVVRLMRLGMTEQRAWATPVGMASWYEAAAYESETGSRLDIVTDGERVAILRAKQKKAENG